jgi:hypothetical protein
MHSPEMLLREVLSLPEDRRRELVRSVLRSLPPGSPLSPAASSATGDSTDADTSLSWEGAQSLLED